MDTVEWGGSIGRASGSARATLRAAGPGTGWRFHAAESSPLGGAGRGALHRMAAVAIVSLALLGGGALAQGLWIVAKAAAGQVLLQSAWERSQANGGPLAPWPWADTWPVARIRVPAQQADVLVLAGATGRTLAWGPGHLDGSAQPGTAGHAVITAHRDTHFAFLARAAPGDEIIVERPDRMRVRYRIASVAVVDHRDLRLSADVAVPTLTLVTCWPFDAAAPGGPLRFVVTAYGSDTTPTLLWHQLVPE